MSRRGILSPLVALARTLLILAPLIVAHLLAVPAARGADIVMIEDSFRFEMTPGVDMTGHFALHAGGGVSVITASLVDGVETLPIAIALGGDGVELGGDFAWAWFEVHALTDEMRVLIGDCVGWAGQPRPLFDRFFAVLERDDQAPNAWVGTDVLSIDQIDQGIAEHVEQLGDPKAAGYLIPPGACFTPGAPPGTVRFIIRLSETSYLIIIIHPDGTVELFIYSQDIDGCWQVGDLPILWHWPMTARRAYMDQIARPGELVPP